MVAVPRCPAYAAVEQEPHVRQPALRDPARPDVRIECKTESPSVVIGVPAGLIAALLGGMFTRLVVSLIRLRQRDPLKQGRRENERNQVHGRVRGQDLRPRHR